MRDFNFQIFRIYIISHFGSTNIFFGDSFLEGIHIFFKS